MEAQEPVPVCAICRAPVGVGSQVTVFPAAEVGAYLASLERTHDPGDGDIILTCLPCGSQVIAYTARAQVS